MNKVKISRRSFLRTSGGAALFSIVPRYVVAGSGMVPPSETVTMLSIGAGGRAVSDIRGLEKAGVRFLALCDVDEKRSAEMRKAHEGLPFYGNYRAMLDKHGKNADAVLIAVPDHWHAHMAIDCLDGIACKDVPKPELFRDAPELFAPTMTREVAKKCRDGMANGAFVYGTKGVIEYGHHGANYLRMLPDTTLEKLRADGGCPKERYPRNKGDSPDEKPFNEFVAAVKGGPKPGSDFAYAGMMTQCSLTGVAALFDAGRTLKWDAAKAVFADSPAANARLSAERIF